MGDGRRRDPTNRALRLPPCIDRTMHPPNLTHSFPLQATRAKEGTGPGGHPLPNHRRRPSNLAAEANLFENEAEEEEEEENTTVERDEGEDEMGRATRTTGTCTPLPSLSRVSSVDSARASPALLPDMPPFLESKESSNQELLRQLGTFGTSESPSPSQRAALSSLYERTPSAETRPRAEEKEEDEDDGVGDDDQLGHAEDEDISGVVEHILARHYIQDRPELKRYDSADAELARAGPDGGGGRGTPHQRKSSATSALSSHLRSELQLEPEACQPVATVLQQPPRTHHHHSRRSSEGFVELPVADLPSPPRHGMAAAPSAASDADDLPPMDTRPTLAHFDSADYFQEKEKGARAAAQRPPQPRAIKPEDEEGGHKATASYLLEGRASKVRG